MSYVTIFPDLSPIHINKDVGIITSLLADSLAIEPKILSYSDVVSEHIHCETGIIKHEKIKCFFNPVSHRQLDLNVLLFLISRSKSIKVLNLYHSTFATHIYVLLYKMINPKGKAYVKLDLDIVNERKIDNSYANGLRNRLKKLVFNYYRKLVDVVSVESQEAYQLLLERKYYDSEKLLKIPNGVCATALNKSYGEVEFKDKKNIILTVARIGNKDKCNELMLDALELCNLDGWDFYFVGPIEEEFKKKIELFYKRNPFLKGKVQFTGEKNRAEINNLYKSAKVFALSSIKEGFPLVFAEASFYGCYIITTEVSGSTDITDGGVYGDLVPIGNKIAYSEAISKVIKSNVDQRKFNSIRMHAIENFTWERILPKLAKKLSNG